MAALKFAENQASMSQASTASQSLDTTKDSEDFSNSSSATDLILVSKMLLSLKEKYEGLCQVNNASPEYSESDEKLMSQLANYQKKLNEKGLIEGIEESLKKDDISETDSENIAKGLQRYILKYFLT
jgi:hypothetical protein